MAIKIDDMVRVTPTNRIHPGCWWVGKEKEMREKKDLQLKSSWKATAEASSFWDVQHLQLSRQHAGPFRSLLCAIRDQWRGPAPFWYTHPVFSIHTHTRLWRERSCDRSPALPNNQTDTHTQRQIRTQVYGSQMVPVDLQLIFLVSFYIFYSSTLGALAFFFLFRSKKKRRKKGGAASNRRNNRPSKK